VAWLSTSACAKKLFNTCTRIQTSISRLVLTPDVRKPTSAFGQQGALADLDLDPFLFEPDKVAPGAYQDNETRYDYSGQK
jgi:hypothetical protein